MGCLALIVICYNDSEGGAIWKTGDQYPPTKGFKVVALQQHPPEPKG